LPARRLTLTRPVLLRARELEAIEEGATRILEEVGIEIVHPRLIARAQQCGFRETNGRIRLSRQQVTEFLQETRQGKSSSRQRISRHQSTPASLTIFPSIYPQSVHDPETDAIVPFTCARLKEATRLVDVLAGRGVGNSIPGCPVDVPPALQVLMQYRIGVENLRYWRGPVDAKSLQSMPYVMEMAEVMGCPIRSLPIYVFSPLRLAGESLAAVMEYEERLESVTVGSMPAAGFTAPLHPVEAFALAAAEVIGAALIVSECIKPAVHWGVSLWPFDLRGIAMSLGSPESVLFEMASAEVNAYLHGQPRWPITNNIHSLAKLPGPQAAAEKASGMTLGALLGVRGFFGAGNLSLDEVFSPVQLLADLEIKDHVERLVNGLNTDSDLGGLAEQVRLGVEGGFAGLERTLEYYRVLYWHPHFFERRFLGLWQAAGCPSFSAQAKEKIRELVAKHDYEPAAEIRAELERIYKHAERELARK